jgi:hypothetical protein
MSQDKIDLFGCMNYLSLASNQCVWLVGLDWIESPLFL